MKRTTNLWGISGIVVLLAATALVGCDSGDAGKKAASSAAPSATTTVKTQDVKSSAVQAATDACADYEKALQACIDKQEGDQKKTWQTELDSHKKAFKEAGDSAKAQLESTCVTGLATVKQACN